MLQGDMKVYISCEGRQLPEYQVEVVDAQSVACYIPSKAGKVLTHSQMQRHPFLIVVCARPLLSIGRAVHDRTTNM